MEFRIEKRGEIAMTGLPLRASTEGGANLREIPAFWGRCNEQGLTVALERAKPNDSRFGLMGVCANDFDEKTKTFTYLVAIERPADPEARRALPPGTSDIMAPAGTWAVFPSRGPMPGAIQAVWKRIYGEWFPTSGYEHADGPDLEVYAPGDIGAADYYSEVWMPVRKASK